MPSTVTSASNGEQGRLSYLGSRVVAAAHPGTILCFGSLLIYTFGLFINPLTAAFHWSREEASRSFALAAMTIELV